MTVNSNAKGKRGEREAVHQLHDWGFPDARRSQQYNGDGLGDVVCEDTLPGVNIEVKYGYGSESLKVGGQLLQDACNQAATDAAGGKWVVLWRVQRGRWWHATTNAGGMLVTVAGDDVPKLLGGLVE